MKFKKIMYGALCVLFVILTAAFISAPLKYSDAALRGIKLWALCVAPSTLPFLFMTALLTSFGAVERLSCRAAPITNKLFKLSGAAAYAFLSGAVCGYPVGAKVISDLREGGLITRDDATGMSVISSMSGPLFIVGSVGAGMYHSAAAGLIILFAQYAAVIITGIIFGRFRPKKEVSSSRLPRLKSVSADGILYSSMYSSVLSVLCVGGFICVFFLLAEMAEDFYITCPITFIMNQIPIFKGLGSGFSKGLIEVTGGCLALSAFFTPASIALSAFIITLGGLSVIFQQVAYLKRAEVNLRVFFLSKLTSALLAFFITLALANIFI